MKYILMASFVNKNQINAFQKVLIKNFNVRETNVFIFEIENNELEYLVTYKIDKENRDNIAKFLAGINTIHVHVKNNCIYTINALNKLIDTLNINGLEDKSLISINWDMYKDKFLIINNGNLAIKNIKKIKLQ